MPIGLNLSPTNTPAVHGNSVNCISTNFPLCPPSPNSNKTQRRFLYLPPDHSDKMLRCNLCKKPFEKASTHRRHGFYCRSKKADKHPPISRRRSCHFCIRRKTRCDAKRPSCSGCSSAGRVCYYGETSFLDPDSTTTTTSLLSEVDVIDTVARPLGLFDDQKLLEITSIQAWNTDNLMIDANLDLTKTTPNSISLAESFQTSNYEDFQPFPISLSLPSLDMSSTAHLYPSITNFRALPVRKIVKTGSEMSVTFVRQILSSYPGMMLRKETFPPFIHSSYCMHGQMPQALANCMSIVQVFSTRTAASNEFVWRTIRMEQERLWVEHGKFGKYELLAAAQAMLIYIIMRMIEGESSNTDFDLPLLMYLSTIFRALEDKIGHKIMGSYDLILDNNEPDHDWQEWTFKEARWRTASIFRIFNMLMDIDSTLCATYPGLVIAPLPGKRMLWEAKSADEWHAEYAHSWTLEKQTYGLSKDGQLVKAEWKQGAAFFTRSPWEEWCSSMDGFGILVMIAASIL